MSKSLEQRATRQRIAGLGALIELDGADEALGGGEHAPQHSR
jgi:hypothetical protein